MSKREVNIEVNLTIDGTRRTYDLDPYGYDDRGSNPHDPTGLSDKIIEAMQASLWYPDGDPKLKGL